MSDDDFTSPQDVAENISDGRPPPPFAGLDRYFDEPEPSADGRVDGLLGWAARANAAQRGGLAKFAAWCAQAPDAERRVILILMERYEGRLPRFAVGDIAALAGISRRTVCSAIKRFTGYFPGAVSDERRRIG